MPIVGIDDEKCIGCKLCYWDCPKLLFAVEEQTNKISFLSQYAETACIECGHCIAICPKNAIKYQGMEDIVEIGDSGVVPNAYENLFSLIRGRRSIRKFKPDAVPEELIEKIMQAIRYAPTNGNVRTLTYAIISDQERIKNLSNAIYDAYAGNPMQKIMTRMREIGLDPYFRGAPHLIVVSSNENLGFHYNNTGISLGYAMLAAHALGLGTCWIGYAEMKMNEVKDLQKLVKARGDIFGILTLGYPDVKYHRLPARQAVRTKKY